MADYEYDKNYAGYITTAGGTPASDPVSIRGVLKAYASLIAAGGGGGGSGTVTSVSVVSANGISGTVATATTTPAITLSTAINGLVKANGTGFAVATAGTDYPATGVITGAGPIGGAASIPVITYNANGQLTTVTTAATVGSVAATDATIVVGGTATAPTIQRAALTGDVTTVLNAATLVSTANVKSIVRGAAYNVRAVSGTDTCASGDLVLATAGAGGFVETLPASTIGNWVVVKKVDAGAGTITITPASGTIDGASTLGITTRYQSYTLVADGTNWNLV